MRAALISFTLLNRPEATLKFSLKVFVVLVCLATSLLAQTAPQNPVPLINQLSPASLRPSQGLTLTISGANFSQNASVQISAPGGIAVRSTTATVNSAGTQIVASFPSSNAFSAAGTLAVTVINGPGLASNVSYLPLTYPTSAANIQSIVSTSIAANTSAVVSADFNGDGIPDLAATNSINNSVQILLGDGAGNFSSTLFIPVGRGPAGILAADFNGDGKVDLAVSNSGDNTVQILLGNGDGTFVTGLPIPTTGVYPTFLVAADFNADGKLDLAVIDWCGDGSMGCAPTGAPFGPGKLTILLGNGDGSFIAAAVSPATGVQPASIVAGDFNSDGFVDLAIANTRSNNITVLMGNGDGTFVTTTSSTVTGSNPQGLLTKDFDGDGALDLAVVNAGDNTVTVLLNQGCAQLPSASCSFAAAQPGVFVGSRPQSIAAADLNGDGFLDLVTANYGGNTINVLLNDGTGKFSGDFFHNRSIPVTANPLGVLVSDFNNDGRTDILVNGVFGNSLLLQSSIAGITLAADNPGTSQSGQQVTFTAAVIPPPGHPAGTGSVTFNDGSTSLGNVSIVSGEASFQTSSLSIGTHQIVGNYSGDGNYPGTSSSTITQIVQQGASTTSLTSDVNPSSAGQTITLTAAVSGGTASGTITFTDGSTSLGIAAVSNNHGQITISSLAVGAHSITASYSGDSNLLASTSSALTQTVNQASTTTAISSNVNPSSFGQTTSLSASVQSAFGGTATGTLTFFDGATVLGTVALSSNSAQLPVSSLSVGTHSLTAKYSGDATLVTSTSPSVQQIVNAATSTTAASSSLNPSNFGQSVTLGAVVSTSSGGTPTGSVTWSDGSAALGTAALSANGSAQLAISTLSVGAHSITAAYSGDPSFSASVSGALTQAVSHAPTTNLVTSSLNPSGYGQGVTFTATVQNSVGGTETGSVNFFDGGVQIGSAVLSGNVARFTTSSLNAGSHSISAVYGGDSNFSGSTSATVTQSVNAASTSTVLASSLNPSSAGQAVTFTASVSSSVAGTQAGSVSLYIDGSSSRAGVASVSGGIAQFSTSTLEGGNHTVTATFVSSNPNFLGSGSSAFTQTVADFRTSVSPSSLTVTRPHSGTYTLTITPVFGFSGRVTVSCSGAPANTSCSVTPSQVTLNGSASVQVAVKIATSGSARTGTYSLRLAASSSSISHTVTAQLILK